MKNRKKSIVVTGAAIMLAAIMVLGGGTYAYLQGSTKDVVNNFHTNKVLVELKETTGNDYEIIPGTTQSKDPKVTVDNTVDSYVYVEITDATDGLVDYTIADGWTKLDGYDNIYYREVAANAETKTFSVLAGDSVTYDAALGNSDMVEGDALKDGVALTFKAHAIQSEPFANAVDAYKQMPTFVSSAADLKEMLQQNGGNIILQDNITVEDGIQLGILKDSSIDFNGKTFSGAFENGTTTNGGPSVNLVLRDPNNNGGYSIDSELVKLPGGGMRQIGAVTAWQPTITIESGKYRHDNAVVYCQLQRSSETVGVVINGGTFEGKGNASVVADIIGSVEINGGTFNATKEGDGSGECIYLSWGSQRVPTITTINDGTFNADGRLFYIKSQSGYTQKIEVKGGNFNVAPGGKLVEVSGNVPATDILVITGGTFNVDPSDYVDTEHYNVTKSNDKWTVTAK